MSEAARCACRWKRHVIAKKELFCWEEINLSNELGKYIALILRHKPEVIGITLDEHGWANVEELIDGIRKEHDFDMELL